MNESSTSFATVIIAACWIIAIANWLGYEPLSTDRYEYLTFGIYIVRFVVVSSIVGAVAYVLYKRL